jgi:hypothetical protein
MLATADFREKGFFLTTRVSAVNLLNHSSQRDRFNPLNFLGGKRKLFGASNIVGF